MNALRIDGLDQMVIHQLKETKRGSVKYSVNILLVCIQVYFSVLFNYVVL